MKKLILIAILLIGGAFSANAWMYNTPCGIAVQTVPPDVFDNPTDAKEFYEALDTHYCGGTDKPDKPGGGGPPGPVDPAPPPSPPQY